MANKLYPPIIEGVLPAFYLTYDTSGEILKGGLLTIPFTMNEAVSDSLIKGFSLRLRTTSSGSYVLPPIYSNIYSLANGEVTFLFSPKQASYLTEGLYYKIQIAYCATLVVDEAGNVSGENIGYYSTVGVAKCTSKPKVTIKGLEYENINAFNNEMFGLYDLTECKDRTEKVYSYEFKVYDEEENIFFTSGEILHKAYYDTDYTLSIDRIILNDFASTDIVYSIEYNVTTLNGLKLSSPRYRVSSLYLVSSNADIKILPESDEEHGIINVHFLGGLDPARSYYYIINDEVLNKIEIDNNGEPLTDTTGKTMSDVTKEALAELKNLNKITYLRNNSLFKHYSYEYDAFYYTFIDNNNRDLMPHNGHYYLKSDLEGYALTDDYLNTLDYWDKIIQGRDIIKSMTLEYIDANYIDLSKLDIIQFVEAEKKYYGGYLLSRASDEDNYTTWFNVDRFKLDDLMPSSIVIQDVTIEHGHKYKYALLQYNIWGLYSARIVSDIFEAKFEDIFLYDGDKWLRIKYNPTIDSFKTTILELKTDTIGGKYPFITRNGATYYKEFPIGGLLAHEIDEYYYFVNPEWGHAHRHATSVPKLYDESKGEYVVADEPYNALWNSHDFSDTTISLERTFKLKVLEWLNNGKPKLFKSPYEGNYIVRLMNNSLTPVKELGRMLHSFLSLAYEIAECNYDNLVAYGFIKSTMPSDLIGLWRSYNLLDENLINSDGTDIIISLDTGISNFTIQDMMPGDMVYLLFSDDVEEMPIMIGITGSYTYENIDRKLVRIRVPLSDKHKITGIINIFYQGMRITDFDSIISMLLKTIISLLYVGTSPWMQALKKTNWDAKVSGNVYLHALYEDLYMELQNYNFRTYLDKVLTYNSDIASGGGLVVSYTINSIFAKLARSFDPGELLDRMNLSINQGEKYKTEVLNMEILRFRERPLIPVYTHLRLSSVGGQYIPGSYSKLYTPIELNKNDEIFLVSTSPYGYPHPIEELSEYEMIDPFCIYYVLEYQSDLDDWVPVRGREFTYYDPYYRIWMHEAYDPHVKMNYNWVLVAYLERYPNPLKAVREESDTLLEIEGELFLKNTSEEYQILSSSSLLSYLLNDQDYLIMTKDARYLYRLNIIHLANKLKKARGEYIDRPINEEEMYDYELLLSHYELNGINGHYYYLPKSGSIEIINENYYDLFEKVNNNYFAIGKNSIEPNTVYWVKKYDIILNLTTEKEIEYRDIDLMNSYHIGNGVVAEATFLLRIIDYYTEIYNEDVRKAKEAYLEAKSFYNNLMKTYNIIAKSDSNRKINHAFMELYYKMIYGNKSGGLEENDINAINNLMSHPMSKEELKLLSLYNITMINTAYDADALLLLVQYKKEHLDENLLTAFNNIEVYYYFESMNNRDIDVYYVLDGRYFNDEENGLFIIDKTKGDIEDKNLVTYRYKYYGDGKIYFYKVNKLAYIDEYLLDPKNALAVEDTLVIIYNPDKNNFEVSTKNDVIASGSELYELKKLTTELTSSYIDLLNTDEVAALKLDDYYLDINLVDRYYVTMINDEWKVSKTSFMNYIKNMKDYRIENGLEVEEFLKKCKGYISYNGKNSSNYIMSILTEDDNIIIDTTLGNIPNRNAGIYYYFEPTDMLNTFKLYKVDEVKYFNIYLSTHPSENRDNLVVVYDSINNRFYVDTINNIRANGTFYSGKIEILSTPVLKTSIEALTEDQVEELYNNPYFISIKDAKRLLYEEVEINDIIENIELDGADNKLKAISGEIDKINNELSDRQSKVETTSVDYVASYNNMITAVNEYNNLVYQDWCGRVAYDLLNNTENNLNKLIAEFLKMLSDTDVVVSTTSIEVSRLIDAANNLYNVTAGDLPYILIFEKMKNDTQEDSSDLDDYLELQIAGLKGKIVIQFLAMNSAIAKIFEYLNGNKIDDIEEHLKFFERTEEVIVKYNLLYSQLINENKEFNEMFRDMTVYLASTYEDYRDILLSELLKYTTDDSYFDLSILAKISNDYDDIKYLVDMETDRTNNIITTETYITVDDEENETITTKQLELNGIVWLDYYNIFSTYDLASSSTFFNPLTNKSSYNFFKTKVANMSMDNALTLNGKLYKDIDTYFYRSSLVKYAGNEAILNSSGNLVTNFIFNPLNTTILDPRFILTSNRGWKINEDNTISSFANNGRNINDFPEEERKKILTNNKQIFDTLTSTLLQEVLNLSHTLASTMLSILNDVNGDTNEAILRSLKRKFILNLIKNRNLIINGEYDTEKNEQIYGAILIMKSRLNTAKDSIILSFGENYIIKNFVPIFYINTFNFDIDVKMPTYYYIPYNTSVVLILGENESEEDFNIRLEALMNDNNWNLPIYLLEEDLEKATKVEQETMAERGVYWEYINLFYTSKVNELTDLLNNALILQRLYLKQVDVYVSKYENYFTEYETNQQIYSNYFGTEAFNYYNALNRDLTGLTDEEIKKIEKENREIVLRYKSIVQKAWWNFLNLLDVKYSAEKERGMYV